MNRAAFSSSNYFWFSRRLLVHSKAPTDVYCKDGATPLSLASRHAQKRCIQILLAAGARKEGCAETRYISALHNAAFNGAVECIQVLLEAKAKVEDFDCDQWTPLHYATRFNNLSAIEHLIRAHADINAQDAIGWTPCHNASRNGLARGIEILLQHGADISINNNCFETPLHIACRKVSSYNLRCVDVVRDYRASMKAAHRAGCSCETAND